MSGKVNVKMTYSKGAIYISNVAITYPQCETPTFNVEQGTTYTDNVDLVMSTATEGATINYSITIAGETFASGEVAAPATVTLNKSATFHVKAVAKKDGYNNSDPGIINVKINKTCPAPTFNIEDGKTLTDATTLRIFSTLEGATLDYKITGPDGFETIEKTGEVAPATEDIHLNGTYYVTATAKKDGYNDSTSASIIFEINKTCGELYADPDGGVYEEPVTFKLYCTTDDALIDYTIENTDTHETVASKTDCESGTEITLSDIGEYQVKATAHKEDYTSSTKTFIYTIANRSAAPTFSLDEGTYTEAKSVTLTTTTDGAKIYYKINDGDETVYTEPIELNESGTFKITAYTAATETTYKSDVVTKTYTLHLPNEPFKLCTNAALLTTGTKVIFACGSKAMSKVQKDNNRGVAGVTITNDEITSKTTDVAVFTIGKSNGNYTFYTDDSYSDNTDKTSVTGYLYAASSSKNYLRTQSTVDSNAEWTITLASNGDATIKAQGDKTNNLLKYNSANSIFSCYSTGQTAPKIYYQPSTSSVSKVSASEGVKVFGTEGGVVVSADKATDVAIYTIAGQLVSRTTVAAGTSTVSVAPGFYVVRAANKAAKVVVK